MVDLSKLKGETVEMTNGNFGRFPTPDFRIRKKLFSITEKKFADDARQKMWGLSFKPLDQDSVDACVAYAGVHWLLASPVINTDWKDDPLKLYDLALKVDGLTHSKNPEDDGTSLGGLFNVFKKNKLVKEYLYGYDYFTGQELTGIIVNNLFVNGPVIVGTSWSGSPVHKKYKGEFFVTQDFTSGSDGHSYCALGFDLDLPCPDNTVGAIRFVNSWGETWGDEGYFWMSISHCDELFSLAGTEVITANELLKGTSVDYTSEAEQVLLDYTSKHTQNT